MRTIALVSAMVVLFGGFGLAMAQSFPAGTVPVRGTVLSVSGDIVTVDAASGAVKVQVTQPLEIYTRTVSDLSHVTPKTFVGVTSSKGADGAEQASEVHIFPEALRGLGEGSYMMSADDAGVSSRMTNGAVDTARTTNGSVNGKAADSSLSVQYAGGSKSITVPQGTPVTILALTKTPLAPGQTVLFLAKKSADGALTSNRVIETTKK